MIVESSLHPSLTDSSINISLTTSEQITSIIADLIPNVFHHRTEITSKDVPISSLFTSIETSLHRQINLWRIFQHGQIHCVKSVTHLWNYSQRQKRFVLLLKPQVMLQLQVSISILNCFRQELQFP